MYSGKRARVLEARFVSDMSMDYLDTFNRINIKSYSDEYNKGYNVFVNISSNTSIQLYNYYSRNTVYTKMFVDIDEISVYRVSKYLWREVQ